MTSHTVMKAAKTFEAIKEIHPHLTHAVSEDFRIYTWKEGLFRYSRRIFRGSDTAPLTYGEGCLVFTLQTQRVGKNQAHYFSKYCAHGILDATNLSVIVSALRKKSNGFRLDDFGFPDKRKESDKNTKTIHNLINIFVYQKPDCLEKTMDINILLNHCHDILKQ